MSSVEEVYRALSERFCGDLIRPGDAEYEKARGIWNTMVARKPGLIARCADVSDVQNAVRSAAATGVLTAVRCGGDSLGGVSTWRDGRGIEVSRVRAGGRERRGPPG